MTRDDVPPLTDDRPGTHSPRTHRADASRRPAAGAWLVLVVLAVGVAALAGIALTWPTGPRVQEDPTQAGAVDFVTATVVGAQWRTCDGTVEDVEPDGTVPAEVRCLAVTAQLPEGVADGGTVEVVATAGLAPADVPPGTRVVLERYPEADGQPEVWAWGDFARGVPLTALAVVFALLTVVVAGVRGLRALLGLALAFGVLGAYLLPAVVAGENPLVVALCASAAIVVTVLYLAHGVSLRTTTALVGTLAGLALVTGLGVVGAALAHLEPVTSEDTFQLSRLLGDDGVDVLRGVFLCGVVLAGLGVLNDVTITQASAVWELRAADPGAGVRELFTRGMRIGRDHIASTVYTIAFAYAGASLPVLLLLEVYSQPLARTLTSGAFAEEIVRTLAGSIGLVLAIPLTTLIAAVVAGGTPHAEVAADRGHVH
ncbi:YibE/F family protein [Cellulomonas sp.]|uniref:YibE/F family protein n=1 Tax=Cellulomonas sp. TaxID=40001 RepID=UPI00281252BF|nr:YibE/F family protein [Cellulomonas sp.]